MPRHGAGATEKDLNGGIYIANQAAGVEEVRAGNDATEVVAEIPAQILLIGSELKPKGQPGLISSHEFVQHQPLPGASKSGNTPSRAMTGPGTSRKSWA